MKKLIAIIALAAAAVDGRAALQQPDLIAQIHFAGAQNISAGKNFSAFTNEFCSAEALALRTQTAGKFAVALDTWLQNHVNVAGPGGAAKLRPLLDDLQKSEWSLEARVAVNGKPEVALAIKLADSRAQLWRANLKPFFPAATFKSSGGWLVFDNGGDVPKLDDQLVQKLSAPFTGWLDLDVNWPRLAQWFPKLNEFGLPETRFTVTAPDANLRITGKFFFPENLASALEPWRVPTNSLHQPFISFTAVRGFASWLKQRSWAQPYQISPAPDQYFTWALPQNPFQTFAAIPVPSAASALNQAHARLLPVFTSANQQLFAPFTMTLTNNEISIHGMPFISPYLRALSEPAGQFLLAGTFPNSPRSKPLPSDLFQMLATKNLVYYHWEITAERLPEVVVLSQLGLMMTGHKQLDANSVAAKWMNKIAPTLGNTATEITQSGPAEMTFVRHAPGGFTAVELFALANWLEAANFPGCNLKLPPRPAKLKRLHPQSPGVMPAPAR